MKSILSKIIVVFSSFFLLTSCYTNIIEDFGSGDGGSGDGDGNGGGVSSDDALVIKDYSELQQFAYATDEVLSVSFYAEENWRVEFLDRESRRWVSVKEGFGMSGDNVLTIYVDKNTWGYDREAYIGLASGSDYETIVISQSAYTELGDVPVKEDVPASYDAIVDEIIGYSVTSDGVLDRSKGRRWKFFYDDVSGSIMNVECSFFSNGDEVVSEGVRLSYLSIGRYEYHLDVNISVSELRDNSVDMVEQTTLACILDDDGRVKYGEGYSNDIRSGEYQDLLVSTFYSDGYLQGMECFIPSTNLVYKNEFLWGDRNLLQVNSGELYDVSSPFVSENRSYTSYPNNKVNVDLNYIFNIEDNPALMLDLLGKRSEYLISSTNDSKKEVLYNYNFDSMERVTEILVSVLSGEKQGDYRYEISYK